MDHFYDRQEAAREESAGRQTNKRTQLESALVTECGSCRKSWKLCMPCDADGVLDEVVFVVQGILSNVNLVPISAGKMEPKKAIRLGQRAEICGLNSQTFEEALARIAQSQDKFQQYFGGQFAQKMSTQNGHFGRAIATSNRIFTMRADYPNEQSTSFEPGVDPLGALERMTTREIFHGPDNVVKYYRRAQNSSKELMLRASEASFSGWYPGGFKIGDIVDLEASLVAVQTMEGGIKVTCRLHALTLLDNTYSKVRRHEGGHDVGPTKSPRRKQHCEERQAKGLPRRQSRSDEE
ncbi:hypothetical protein B0H16DRAFT_1699455 [Mycena metata]|uniref:Uncharacterized protein n=1 Tax=Mycena metata TaxID=1033252 RepID=A0AAD7ML15_9AGAR|nr:hypothetical protein B0H16DRAFT_1699455 [Mycena metata]